MAGRPWSLGHVPSRIARRTRRLTANELLHALMREAEQIGRISEPEVEILDQRPRRLLGRRLRGMTRLLRTGALRFTHADRIACARGKPHLLDELRAVSVVNPQAERLAKTSARLLERPTVRMTTADAGRSCEPSTALVALEDRPVLARLHRSHFLPRHGSRSRSIARSVPGGRSSPARTGVV